MSQILEFEQQYLDALPSASMYERSYMHRDTVNNVAVSAGRAAVSVQPGAGRAVGAGSGRRGVGSHIPAA